MNRGRKKERLKLFIPEEFRSDCFPLFFLPLHRASIGRRSSRHTPDFYPTGKFVSIASYFTDPHYFVLWTPSYLALPRLMDPPPKQEERGQNIFWFHSVLFSQLLTQVAFRDRRVVSDTIFFCRSIRGKSYRLEHLRLYSKL